MNTEDEFREAQVVAFNAKDEELTDHDWRIKPKTVRFEIPLRYMSRMELRELLNTLAGALQFCINETHEERRVMSMINNIHDSIMKAQDDNQRFRDIQGERVRKRNG